MKHRQFVAFIIICFAFESCAPFDIISNDLSPEARSKNFRTYNFTSFEMPMENPTEQNLARFEMLKSAIAREIEKVGLTQSNDPDVLVNIGVVVEEKQQTRTTDFRDAPRYMNQRNYHWESEEIVIDEYRQGTVTIDIVDAETQAMVAQSVASALIDKKDDKLKQRIDKGMALVFKDLWLKDGK